MPSFQCPKCELLFAAQGELDWHMREEHRQKPERTPQATVPERPDPADDLQPTGSGNGGRDTARRTRWWPPWRRSA
jgi:hypothetical protein